MLRDTSIRDTPLITPQRTRTFYSLRVLLLPSSSSSSYSLHFLHHSSGHDLTPSTGQTDRVQAKAGISEAAETEVLALLSRPHKGRKCTGSRGAAYRRRRKGQGSRAATHFPSLPFPSLLESACLCVIEESRPTLQLGNTTQRSWHMVKR